METKTYLKKISRRNFLFLLWIIPISTSYILIRLFTRFFPGNIDWKILKGGLRPNSVIVNTINSNGGKWHKESLILNVKSNVVHYPSIRLFKYYNRIADRNIKIIDFRKWEHEIVSPKHFIKSKSGIIFEELALRKLNNAFSNTNLQKAIDILSTAFSEKYINGNKYQVNTLNWRLYHLLIQLIVLNTIIPPELRWSKFSTIIKYVNFQGIKLNSKNDWIFSKPKFDNRAKYIEENLDQYKKRIQGRVKYL